MLTGQGRAGGAPRVHPCGSSRVPTLLLQPLAHSRGGVPPGVLRTQVWEFGYLSGSGVFF